MRIYNPKNSTLDLPIVGTTRVSIAPRSVSGDILANTEMLSLLVKSFNYDELALIVTGASELNLCANVSGSVGFVVQSLDEAIERFTVSPEEIEDNVFEPDTNEPTTPQEPKKSEKPKPETKKPGTEKPENPKVEVKPENPKPEVKPENPKPEVKPENPKPEVKPENPKPKVEDTEKKEGDDKK